MKSKTTLVGFPPQWYEKPCLGDEYARYPACVRQSIQEETETALSESCPILTSSCGFWT